MNRLSSDFGNNKPTASIGSCLIGSGQNTVDISLSSNGDTTGTDGKIYLFELRPYESEIGSRTDYVSSVGAGETRTVSIPLNKGTAQDRLYSRFVPAVFDHNPSAREMDMLLATGEQISISLLAMALNELGCHAISLTGWQAGFRTDRAYTKARISRLETERISSELERNRVVVVAGFQGLNKLDDITTLGRGGSDTSAVAIAAALHADRCQIFTDVEGVYTADPRKVRNTRKLEEITFDEMLELASLGAQVLNNRSVELAKKYNVELEVLSSLNPVPGTVVKEVTKDMEGMLIKGVAKDTDVAVITILNLRLLWKSSRVWSSFAPSTTASALRSWCLTPPFLRASTPRRILTVCARSSKRARPSDSRCEYVHGL